MGLSPKLLAGLQSALLSKWTLFTTGLGSVLTDEWLHGNFATFSETYNYVVHRNGWWIIVTAAFFGGVMGAGQRAQQKINYVGAVESGTASSGTSVVYKDPSTTTVTGTQPPTVEPPKI